MQDITRQQAVPFKNLTQRNEEEYFKDSNKRLKTANCIKKTVLKLMIHLKFKTPKGKTVYGGGGIVPDIFVPLEVEHGDESIAYLMQSGVVGNYVFEQLDKNRKDIQWIDFCPIPVKMEKTDLYFNNFQEYLTKEWLLI